MEKVGRDQKKALPRLLTCPSQEPQPIKDPSTTYPEDHKGTMAGENPK